MQSWGKEADTGNNLRACNVQIKFGENGEKRKGEMRILMELQRAIQNNLRHKNDQTSEKNGKEANKT